MVYRGYGNLTTAMHWIDSCHRGIFALLQCLTRAISMINKITICPLGSATQHFINTTSSSRNTATQLNHGVASKTLHDSFRILLLKIR